MRCVTWTAPRQTVWVAYQAIGVAATPRNRAAARRTAEAAVAADRHATFALTPHQRAEGAPERLGQFLVHRRGYGAAQVIGLEDAAAGPHGASGKGADSR
jgi:hypothetical protein